MLSIVKRGRGMKISNVGYIDSNCNGCKKQTPAFKSVKICATEMKRGGRLKHSPHLYLNICQDAEPWLVKDSRVDCAYDTLGISGIASSLSNMAKKFGIKIADNDFSRQVRQSLAKLRQENSVFWGILEKRDLRKIDSIIERGEIIQIDRNSFAMAISPKAIKFLTEEKLRNSNKRSYLQTLGQAQP